MAEPDAPLTPVGARRVASTLTLTGETITLAEALALLSGPACGAPAKTGAARSEPGAPNPLARARNAVRSLSAQIRGCFSEADYLAYRWEGQVVKLPLLSELSLWAESEEERLRLLRDPLRTLLEDVLGHERAARVEKRQFPASFAADLRYAREELGVDELSTHAYDRLRAQRIAEGKQELVSSSVMRKYAGSWGTACGEAQVACPHISGRRVGLTVPEAIEALRTAKQLCGGRLTPEAYERVRRQVRSGEPAPSVTDILRIFTRWHSALNAADVDQRDWPVSDGEMVWSAWELRRIAGQSETVLRRLRSDPAYELDGEGYEWLRARSKRCLPSWGALERAV